MREVAVGYQERTIWVQVLTTLVALGVYIPWTIAAGTTEGGEWLWRMMWVIGGSVALSVTACTVWNMAAGITRADAKPDERDIRISHASERVGTAFLVIAGLVAIVLCAQAVSPFWIAHTIAAGFALSSLVGGLAALGMYHEGIPTWAEVR